MQRCLFAPPFHNVRIRVCLEQRGENVIVPADGRDMKWSAGEKIDLIDVRAFHEECLHCCDVSILHRIMKRRSTDR